MQRLQGTNRLAKELNTVHFSKGFTLVFKKTPVVFDIQHLIRLFFRIVAVSGITILMEGSLSLLIHADPDIFRTDSISIFRINHQHRHPVQTFFAPGNRIAAKAVRQNMADLRFSTAAAGFLVHADNNSTPVIGTILDEIPYLFLSFFRSLTLIYAFTIPFKSLISVVFPHCLTK